jgi:3-oxoacyl-[acyl-carrier-protein] synthase-3
MTRAGSHARDSIGIHGVGVYLPEIVRRNDHWSSAQVAAWREKARRRLDRIQDAFPEAPREGQRLVLEAMLRMGDDPFQGIEERRAMPSTMTAVDMQTAAARQAIERSGVRPDDIGLVMSFTLCPDFLYAPDACAVHSNLGLKRDCISLGIDSVCNSLMMQLTLAQAMIASGRVQYALLTQCSAMTRMPSSGEHYDTWFGDAATAVVVGPVQNGYGILSYSHRTEGKLHRALVCGVPGKRWFDLGEVVSYSEDHAANFDMCVNIADRSKEVADEALRSANLSHDSVDFYACHQAFLWLREVTQKVMRIEQAKSVDTFKWAGSLSAATLPLVLARGEEEGLLRAGDHVVLFQGGTGITYSSMVIRWGK